VTMISQDQSQFALHARAILGLPIPEITFYGPSASSVVLVNGESDHVTFNNINEALREANTQVRLFGKPEVKGQRRMGVVLARDITVEAAKQKAMNASSKITTTL
jgi:phosphoribosylglycinamide formyltransferase 2